MYLYTLTLQFVLSGTKSPEPAHKAMSIKICFANIGVKELECPALNPDLNSTPNTFGIS